MPSDPAILEIARVLARQAARDDHEAALIRAGERITIVQCLRCGHSATLGGDADELPLVRLTKRLVCSVCGARTMKAERVVPSDQAIRPKRS